jgi:hypothetical protein
MYSLLEECQLNQRAIEALPDIVAALQDALLYIPESNELKERARAALKKGGF